MKKGLFFLILITFLLPLMLFADENESMNQAHDIGEQSAHMVTDQLQSSSGIQEHIINPLTTSDIPMKTYGKTYTCSSSGGLFPSLEECQQKCKGQCEEYQGFNAQLQAPASHAFLKVQIIPTGQDDYQIIVYQDDNFDGNFDYTYLSSFKDAQGNDTQYASGACTHGVVVCSPGTWLNCAYYFWMVNDEGHLELKQAMTDSEKAGVGTCYCVNASCGNYLQQAISEVLDTVATGAAMVLAQAKGISISQAEKNLDELAVLFYGQNPAEMKHASDPTQTYSDTDTVSSLEDAYTTGALPVDEEISEQQENPDSYYSQLTSSQFMEVTEISGTYTCRIRRKAVVVKNEQKCEGYEGIININGQEYCLISEYNASQGGTGTIEWTFNYSSSERHVYFDWLHL